MATMVIHDGTTVALGSGDSAVVFRADGVVESFVPNQRGIEADVLATWLFATAKDEKVFEAREMVLAYMDGTFARIEGPDGPVH